MQIIREFFLNCFYANFIFMGPLVERWTLEKYSLMNVHGFNGFQMFALAQIFYKSTRKEFHYVLDAQLYTT